MWFISGGLALFAVAKLFVPVLHYVDRRLGGLCALSHWLGQDKSLPVGRDVVGGVIWFLVSNPDARTGGSPSLPKSSNRSIPKRLPTSPPRHRTVPCRPGSARLRPAGPLRSNARGSPK